jgi:hypothetical protein
LIPECLPHLLSIYSTNLLSRICLLRFFKYNKLKMSKTHFFQMAPRIYCCKKYEKLEICKSSAFQKSFIEQWNSASSEFLNR